MVAQHVLNGRDRPVEFGPWPQVGGGQIWTQTAFPCFSDFVVFLGDGTFVLINNPMDSRGNCAYHWRARPLGPEFTSEELQAFLHRYHYQYEGQCHDLIWNRDRP